MPDNELKEYEALPWERQPGEPWKDYEAFTVYREGYPQASIDQVYRVWKDDPDASATGAFREKAKKYKWEDRAKRWRKHQAKNAEALSAVDLQSRKREQARTLREFQQTFTTYLEQFNEWPLEERIEKLDELDMKEMIQAFSLAAEEERKALGDDEGQDAVQEVAEMFVQAAQEAQKGEEIEADYEILEEEDSQ